MLSADSSNTPGNCTAGPPRRRRLPYYVVDDNMGESGLQFSVTHFLVELLRFYFESMRRTMLVSGNQYIHFRQGDEQANIAPDVYVIPDDPTPAEKVESWKLWEHAGKGPCLAIEVVSRKPKEARKDYAPEMLAKYDAMGVTELFRYDPHHGHGRRRVLGQQRRWLTHWVRGEDGRLVEQALSEPGRARSVQFDFWIVCTGCPEVLRLGVGPEGLSLWPTRYEDAKRRAQEADRRAAEEARRAQDAERRLAEALAELARLRSPAP